MISPGEPASLSGQDLLAEFVRGGHEGPFEEIVRRYAGMVFNVCLKVTHDKHEAEDATQAVFLTLAVQVKRGTDIKALGPWLQQVARRLSLDMRRSQKRRKRREEQHYDLHTTRREALNDAAVSAPDIDELKAILHEELQKLPAKYRLPLVLHYFGGMSRDEMAGELNCKASTLGVRIFRGRQMLAGKLSSRGVTLPDETLGLLLGVTVKSKLTEAAVHGSGHAAAIAGGHGGVGLISSRVIALSRRATSALLLGKIKLAVTFALLAGLSLGTLAKAAGMLPNLSFDRLVVEPIRRWIEPLMQPLSAPLQASAATASKAVAPVVEVGQPAVTLVIPPTAITVKTAAEKSASERTRVVPAAAADAPDAFAVASPVAAEAAVRGDALSDAAVATASTVASPDPVDATALQRGEAAIEASAGDSLIGAGGGGGLGGGAGGPSPGLYLPPSRSGTSTESGGSMSFASVLVIPTQTGKVLERDGVLRGWGKIARTGTFDANGKVIADGGGVDHTLDLTSFSSIVCTTPNSADGGQNGWYAVDHGRLDMKLQGGAKPSVLTWGESPADAQLSLVNSVRLTLTSTNEQRPAALSLLAVDRDDLPSFSGMGGVPIGLWQVDGPGGDVDSADVTIRYDDAAVADLGTGEYGVRLWFYCGDQWQIAAPQSFSLDVADHLATGAGEDFSYFALTVPDVTATVNGVSLMTPVMFDSTLLPAAGLPEPGAMLGVTVVVVALMRRRERAVIGSTATD